MFWFSRVLSVLHQWFSSYARGHSLSCVLGIMRISSHVMCHTFCTRLIQEGVPLPTVSRLAGHSSVETTIRYYVHTSQVDKMAAVAKLL